MAQAVAAETGAQARLSGRHHDRAAARGALAGEIAESAEFFSFGTNDLTQTTFGISRDDAASFLGAYMAKGILAADPFVSIDREGVGELDPHRRRARPQDAAASSSSASAASMAATRPRSRSATRSGSIMSRARRSACRSRGSPRRRRRSAKGVFAVLTWQYLGFGIILLLAGLQGVPAELKEAAAIDGATPWQVTWRVTLPLLGPTIRIWVFITVIGSLQVFDVIWLMTQGGPAGASDSMATYMYRTGFQNEAFSYGTAIAIIMFLFCFVFALVYQRFALRRDTAGALTGAVG